MKSSPRFAAPTLGLAAFSLAVLAGCGSPPSLSSPQGSALPLVAPDFGPTAAVGSANVAKLAWNEYFSDPRLLALIGLALEHNRDLRVAAANIEQARAQAQAREADLWPTVNLALAGARVPTNNGSTSTTVTGGLATAAYEVDLSGRIRQQISAAGQQWRASEYLHQAARASLVAAVAAAYGSLRADDALLEVTRQTVANRQEGLSLVQARLAAGAATALELAQAKALLQSAQAALAQIRRQREIDHSSLVLLVGRPLPDDLPPAPTLALGGDGAEDLPELRAGLPSEVVAQRADIAAAEAQLRAAAANVDAARLALFPRISLTASLGRASRELSSLFSGGQWVFGVAPQLLAPIFDAGRLKAGVAQASAAQSAALAQYEKSVQVAFKEVSDALAARETLREQMAALQAQVQAEAERARLAQARWRFGASGYLEVLDAQRSLYSAQISLIQTQAQAMANQAMLFKALGGGSVSERPASTQPPAR